MSVKGVQISTSGLIPNTSGLGLGLTQQMPTPIYINTNDTLATVTTTGYLTKSHTNFQYPFKCDVPSGVVAASMNHVGSYQVLSLLALLVRFTSTKVPCLTPKEFTNIILGHTRRTSLFLRIGKDGGF